MKFLLALCMVLTMANASSAQQQTPPEIIFINGDIYTGAHSFVALSPTLSLTTRSDVEGKRAQALAVSGGKMVGVGSNDEIQKLKGPNTKIIDLGGHFAMPG